jgi:hypothetical protein
MFFTVFSYIFENFPAVKGKLKRERGAQFNESGSS